MLFVSGVVRGGVAAVDGCGQFGFSGGPGCVQQVAGQFEHPVPALIAADFVQWFFNQCHSRPVFSSGLAVVRYRGGVAGLADIGGDEGAGLGDAPAPSGAVLEPELGYGVAELVDDEF